MALKQECKTEVKALGLHSDEEEVKALGLNSDEEETDVVFVCDEQSFPAHRHIMAKVSPYFNAMFNSGFREKKDKVVKLYGIKAKTMETVLNFIYKGSLLNMDDLDLLTSVYEAAHFWNLSDIQDNWHRILNKKNINELWNLADKYNDTELLIRIKQFLERHLFPPTHVNVLFTMSYERLIAFFKMALKNKKLSSTEVLKYTVQWIQLNETSGSACYESLKEIVFFENVPSCYARQAYHLMEENKEEIQEEAKKAEESILLIYLDEYSLNAQEILITNNSSYKMKDSKPLLLTRNPMDRMIQSLSIVLLNIMEKIYLIKNDVEGHMHVWVYDLISLIWERKSLETKKRFFFHKWCYASGTVVNDVIYVMGIDRNCNRKVLLLCYDPNKDEWNLDTEYEAETVTGHVHIVSVDGSLYMILSTGIERNITLECHKYNSLKREFSKVSQYATVHYYHMLKASAAGSMIYIRQYSWLHEADFWITYDLRKDLWTNMFQDEEQTEQELCGTFLETGQKKKKNKDDEVCSVSVFCGRKNEMWVVGSTDPDYYRFLNVPKKLLVCEAETYAVQEVSCQYEIAIPNEMAIVELNKINCLWPKQKKS